MGRSVNTKHHGLEFFRKGDMIIRLSDVVALDVSKLKEHEVRVYLREGDSFVLTGADAVDLVMLVKPSALEGRRLRWARGAWAAHNLLGHPIMQILAWLRAPQWGIWIHEATTPRPQNDTRGGK